MSKALVVCPATDDLELIDFLDSPLGPLIHACSRFRPATALACGRGCAQCTRTELSSPVASFDTGEVEAEIDPDDTDVDLIPPPCVGREPR